MPGTAIEIEIGNTAVKSIRLKAKLVRDGQGDAGAEIMAFGGIHVSTGVIHFAVHLGNCRLAQGGCRYEVIGLGGRDACQLRSFTQIPLR